MFCGKCGAENADNAQFCKGCGAKLNEGQTPKSMIAVTVDGKNKNRKIGMIAAAAGVVIVIALLVNLFGGRSYKKTVNKFMDATFNADAKTIMELVPDKIIDYALEEAGYDDDELDDLIDEMNETSEDLIESLERYYGEDWSFSYEILDVENLTDRKLNSVKDDYEENGVKVSAAKTVEVEFTIKGDDTDISNSVEVPVIKVGRSWYLDIINMDSIF